MPNPSEIRLAEFSRPLKRLVTPAADPPLDRRATAAVAWLVATLGIVHAGLGEGLAGNPYFWGLGGGAAYLAWILPRRGVSAWRAARQVAAATGTINLVVLPSLIFAFAVTLIFSKSLGSPPVSPQWLALIGAAGAATALPWMFYHTLGDERVRRWFHGVGAI